MISRKRSKTSIKNESGDVLAMTKESHFGYGCSLLIPGGKTVFKLRPKSFWNETKILEDSEKK